jgi:hypothetical protein
MADQNSLQNRSADRAGSHGPASRVKRILLPFALALGTASTASAASLTINTDTSWLAFNLPPPTPEWLFDPAFDTTGWTNAFVSTVTLPAPCFNGADCIWYDDQQSTTQAVWLRKTFTISGTVVSAFLEGGVDDDADIYVNGTLVYSVHDGSAGNFGPIYVAPYLVQGVNLIAVAADDNFFFGQNHLFTAQLQIQTQVPEPTSLALIACALASLVILRRRGTTGGPLLPSLLARTGSR